MEICEKQHSMRHNLHLTDGNDARCFIAAHTRCNNGVQQPSVNLANRGNASIRVGGFQLQCQYRGKRRLVAMLLLLLMLGHAIIRKIVAVQRK